MGTSLNLLAIFEERMMEDDYRNINEHERSDDNEYSDLRNVICGVTCATMTLRAA